MSTLLIVHVGLSFMALGLGAVAIAELYASEAKIGTWLFLATGFLATVTGFFLPFETVTPAVAVGIISTLVFILLTAAFAIFRYKTFWRAVYAVCVVISVYFLVFVTVAQAFLKIDFLKALAPTGKEPPFAVAQLIVLVAFIVIGRKAVKRFYPRMTS